MPARLSVGMVRRIYTVIRANGRQYVVKTPVPTPSFCSQRLLPWHPIPPRAREDARLVRVTASTTRRELVIDAVLMAVRRRHSKRSILHSDQRSRYGSDDWQRFCRNNHFEPSMSRRGNCWDNAVAESLFSSLKKERIKQT